MRSHDFGLTPALTRRSGTGLGAYAGYLKQHHLTALLAVQDEATRRLYDGQAVQPVRLTHALDWLDAWEAGQPAAEPAPGAMPDGPTAACLEA